MKCFRFLLVSMSVFWVSNALSQNIDQLLIQTNKIDSPSKRLEFYFEQCEKLEQRPLLIYALKFLDYATEVNSTKGKAQACDNLGYYYQKNNFDSAIYFYRKALYFYEKEKSNEDVGRMLNELGVCNYYKGNLNKALEYYQKSYIYKKDDDPSKFLTLNNIALVYTKLKQPQEALATYNKILKDKLLNKTDSIGQATVLQNIGVLYIELGNYQEAEKYLVKAISVIDNRIDIKLMAMINLGKCYIYLKEYDKAKAVLRKGVPFFSESGNKRALSMAKGYLALAMIKTGEADRALELAKEAYQISEEFHVLEGMEQNANVVSQAYQLKGDFKNALRFYKIHMKLHDSLVSEKTKNQLMELNVKFESKQKDLELLRSQDLVNRKEILIQKQTVESQQRARTLMLISVFGGILFLITIYIFRAYRQKQKANEIISAQKKEVELQKAIIEEQKSVVEESKKEIIDSIHYARRIQSALLAHNDFLKSHLPDHFVLFKPKDIVSGDFYWATSVNSDDGNRFYIAVCDSTGHGVPGAFMSLLSISYLSEAINEKNIEAPGDVFNYVRTRLTESVSRDGQQDGFDGILLCFNKKGNSISYAAANNAPVIIHQNNINHLPYSKMPVGTSVRNDSFETFSINYQKGDVLYLYTDGYADQFGGERGKKFMYKKLDQLLLDIHKDNLSEQKNCLLSTFDTWKGNLEQVDDVCVIGISL
jgi:serine phosphatase RsbU (regulator of sigma subunit)